MLRPFHFDFANSTNEELIKQVEGVLAECEIEIPQYTGEVFQYLVDLKKALTKVKEALLLDDRIAALVECYGFLETHDLFKKTYQSIY